MSDFEILTFDTKYPNFKLDDYFDGLKIDYRISEGEDHEEWAINCPSCVERGEPSPDSRKKLWVNMEKAKFYCYRCQWSGSIAKLLQKLSNIPLESAFKILRGKQLDPMEHLHVTLFEEKFDRDDADELPEIDLPYGYEPIEDSHPYLKKRGIPIGYAQTHDWGFSTVGYTRNRIIVPTFMESRLVFWQARATWDEPHNKEFKKVLNPKGVSSRAILYNYDQAKEYETVVLTEGFIDAVKVGPNAMATNGKRLHAEQVEWLSKSRAKRVILAWDADAWTDVKRRANGEIVKVCSMQRATELLRLNFEVKCCRFPRKQDAGSFKRKSKELMDIIANAEEPEFE